MQAVRRYNALDIRMSQHENVLRECNMFEHDCDVLSVASM